MSYQTIDRNYIFEIFIEVMPGNSVGLSTLRKYLDPFFRGLSLIFLETLQSSPVSVIKRDHFPSLELFNHSWLTYITNLPVIVHASQILCLEQHA